MANVALIIIYNHQFNRNIEILESIYQNRFSNIFHLVPFYTGNKANVIPVYENSHCFQGYVAQGYKSYFQEDFNHYFFIGDDLLLNPSINEKNYTSRLKLDAKTCFLPEFITLHERGTRWYRIAEAFSYDIKSPGVEVTDQLPDYKRALALFSNFGLEIKPLGLNSIWKGSQSLKSLWRLLRRDPLFLFRLFGGKLKYPLVGSYSDVFVVSADAIREFVHYCGVFASTRLFVEFALPTALVLAAKEIVTEKDLDLRGRALWTENDFSFLKQYNFSLNSLISDFPKDYMYLHPIKLSKWK